MNFVNTPISRRRFLQTSAIAAAAPFLLPSHVWAAATGPNSRISLGIIGMGTMGRGLMGAFLREGDVQVTAVCDVDETRREHHRRRVNEHYAGATGLEGYRGCAAYGDFRELLSRDDIDGVVIATPDHWHAIMAILAAQAGKDIYCEKPLCQSVNEAVRIVQAVEKHKRVFQTGSQQRSSGRFREACELVRNGRLGALQRVEVSLPPGIGEWCDLPESDPPDGLDWDFWLGPAPRRGWHEILSPVGVHDHFPRWRNYREYGGGMVTDWGAHHFDIAHWGMGMDESGPVEVIPPEEPNATAGTELIYPGGIEVKHLEGNGVRFVGVDGEVTVHRGGLSATPQSLAEDPLPDDAIRLYASSNHTRNWLDCMRSRQRPICDATIGARSVIVCHLANMAYWHGQRFRWDPSSNTFAGGTGNTDWLDVSYRSPWRLPEV
jgi:predicted dehydrogenase